MQVLPFFKHPCERSRPNNDVFKTSFLILYCNAKVNHRTTGEVK